MPIAAVAVAATAIAIDIVAAVMRVGTVAVRIAVGAFAAAFEQAFLSAGRTIAATTAATAATPAATTAARALALTVHRTFCTGSTGYVAFATSPVGFAGTGRSDRATRHRTRGSDVRTQRRDIGC